MIKDKSMLLIGSLVVTLWPIACELLARLVDYPAVNFACFISTVLGIFIGGLLISTSTTDTLA